MTKDEIIKNNLDIHGELKDRCSRKKNVMKSPE